MRGGVDSSRQATDDNDPHLREILREAMRDALPVRGRSTRPDHRNRGYASSLMRRAVELAEPPIWLKAQEYLRDWYASFGFEVSGESWMEDGIPHVPMRLDA